MPRNENSVDRIIRVILGLAIIAAGIVFHSWWGAIGAVPLLTAAIGWCPLYSIFGVNTCKVPRHV